MQRRQRIALYRAFGWVSLASLAALALSATPASATTTVVVQHSGQCLDVRGGPQNVDDGAIVEQWPCTGALNQSWTLQDAGNSQFRLVVTNNGRCVDTINGGTTVG